MTRALIKAELALLNLAVEAGEVFHTSGSNFTRVDGSVRLLATNIDVEPFAAMGTIDGDEGLSSQ